MVKGKSVTLQEAVQSADLVNEAGREFVLEWAIDAVSARSVAVEQAILPVRQPSRAARSLASREERDGRQRGHC